MIHIGFTGTRVGMSPKQREMVQSVLMSMFERKMRGQAAIAHHGDCVGADEEFDAMCTRRPAFIVKRVAHPGPPSGWTAGCDVEERRKPKPYMPRNRDIIDESPDLVIAAPYEMEPQPRGGTWGTIAMARTAQHDGLLRRLVIVLRDGCLMDHLDHAKWPLRLVQRKVPDRYPSRT